MKTPLPCAFEPVSQFMEVPYEEAKAEYFKLLESHVEEALTDSEDIWRIMRSDLAVDRFALKEWTGTRGVSPLNLKTREDFPESMRVRARPINPRLYEVEHKEFQQIIF